MNPRALAVNCTAKLYTFRKTRDGVFAQFVIHPNEVPEKLQKDPIGTSYMMALVEVDDATGQPKGGGQHSGDNRPQALHEKAPRQFTQTGGAHKSWDELQPSQQAGILCGNPAFWKFLNEDQPSRNIQTPEQAAEFVRRYCKVKTRADIVEGDKSNDFFQQIVNRYHDWHYAARNVL